MTLDNIKILATDTDWQIIIDLKKRLYFPEEIVKATLRPDTVIWLTATKKVIMIKLITPEKK